MPRFVILEHDHPEPHLDFMLEENGALLTWRLPADLQPVPGETLRLQARPLPEHRLHYLTYEGPVSGNRGSVRQRDAGEFEWLARAPAHWKIALRGQTYHAEVELVGSHGHEEFHWQAIKR